MARVPRYGTHNGIKYSPRRTIFHICLTCCKIIFQEQDEHPNAFARRQYCFICARNKQREHRRNHWGGVASKNRNKDDHAEEERQYYKNRPIYKNSDMERTKKQSATTNHVVGEPQADWTDDQWMEYSAKIKKMKTATYSDSYYNTYE
jgi:hypothetical protein